MIHRRHFLSASAAALVVGAVSPSLLAECRATSSATKGPFWRPDAPFTDDLRRDGGETVTVHGVVRSARTCKPVAGALLDVWQADHHGKYDLDYGRNVVFGRARIRTDANGAYTFRTTKPAPYGQRPAHIHFVLSAEGHRPLTTQLYFEGDPHLGSDPQDAVHPDLVRPVRNARVAFDVFLG